eukprot:65598_1
MKREHDLMDDGCADSSLKDHVPSKLAAQEEIEGDVDGYKCRIQGCGAILKTTLGLAEHRESFHRYRCASCGAVMSTARLLDLHLLECHDSLFAVRAERQPMYACFIEGCPKMCNHSRGRRLHLEAKHGLSAECIEQLVQQVSYKVRNSTHSKRQQQRCKFFDTPQGCNNGTNCKFLHEKVIIPSNISFGRHGH